MNTPRGGLRVAAFVFAIVCLAHIGRVIEHVDLALGHFHVPMWWSTAAFIFAGAMSLWMWALSKR